MGALPLCLFAYLIGQKAWTFPGVLPFDYNLSERGVRKASVRRVTLWQYELSQVARSAGLKVKDFTDVRLFA